MEQKLLSNNYKKQVPCEYDLNDECSTKSEDLGPEIDVKVMSKYFNDTHVCASTQCTINISNNLSMRNVQDNYLFCFLIYITFAFFSKFILLTSVS